MTKCKILSYADDTTIYYSSKYPSNLQMAINEDLKNIEKWFKANKLKLNEDKTECIIIQPPNMTIRFDTTHIKVKNKVLQPAEDVKILGININRNLKWDKHINEIIRNCKYQLRSFRRAIKYINHDEQKLLYNSCLASRLSYGDIIWKNTTVLNKKRLQVIQNDAARSIMGKKPRESAKPLLKELKWMNLEDKRKLHSEVMLHKIGKGNAPMSLINMAAEYKHQGSTDTRYGRANGYSIPSYRTNIMANSFFITTIKTWNKIPIEIRQTEETKNFKSRLNMRYIC